MSAPSNTSKHATVETVPESPTTVHPFEMEEDDEVETGVMDGHPAIGDSRPTTVTSSNIPPATTSPTSGTNATPTVADEAPPPNPVRPVTEQQKNETILREAFPTIDASIIKAVLTASGGRIDPAFNALLGMSDPDAVQNDVEAESAPPPQPPRPSGPRAPLTQLEADELYARQLAHHYDSVGAYEDRTSNRGGGAPRTAQATGLKPNEMHDREHSFLDDDLPVIKENLRKGFVETQTKVNSWITKMKKRIDGEYDSEEDESQPSKHRPAGSGRRSGDGSRRSNDYERYDADPQVLSDDFAGIRLNPDGSRTGNPNLYRPPPSSTSARPDRPETRKVAFKDGPDELYETSPTLPPKDATLAKPQATKQSKWQPMSTIEPDPVAEHDPFSLGDSEDEKDVKDKTASKTVKPEDSERLRQNMDSALSDDLVGKTQPGEVVKKEDLTKTKTAGAAGNE